MNCKVKAYMFCSAVCKLKIFTPVAYIHYQRWIAYPQTNLLRVQIDSDCWWAGQTNVAVGLSLVNVVSPYAWYSIQLNYFFREGVSTEVLTPDYNLCPYR